MLNKKGINGTYAAIAVFIGIIIGVVAMLFLFGGGDIMQGTQLLMGGAWKENHMSPGQILSGTSDIKNTFPAD